MAALMGNIEGVSVLLGNMSTAFLIDNDGNRIEDVTEDGEILKMIKQGKMVRLYNNDVVFSIVLSRSEVYACE